MEMTSADRFNNPTDDRCSPISSGGRGPAAETSFPPHLSIIKASVYISSIVFFFLGCVIACQYFHVEKTFQRKFDPLNESVNDLRQKNSDLEKRILLLASNITTMVSEAIQRSHQEVQSILNFRAQTIENKLFDMNSSSNADNQMKTEFFVKEMKNLHERMDSIDTTTSFLLHANTITSGLISETQESIEKLNETISSIESTQNLRQEV